MQAAAAAGKFRTGMHGKIAALDARALRADERAHAARAAAAATQQQVEAAKEELRALQESNEELKAALAAESDWQRKDAHSSLSRMPIGGVSPEVRKASSCLRVVPARLAHCVVCFAELILRLLGTVWCA